MKAMIYTRYGSPNVLEIHEVPTPEPKHDEVRIQVHAATVSAGDSRMRRADPFAARLYNGLFRPRRVRILGFELAGVIDACGEGVTRFSVGDAVFAACGIGFGAHAAYRCLPQSGIIAHKPSNLSFEEAAAVPVGAGTAMRLLRKAEVRSDQDVLIYGASGSVGTYTVQLAAFYGARVTGVCSGANLSMVSTLGATAVIDYVSEDYAAQEQRYDLVLDCVGKSPTSQRKRALKPGGRTFSVMKLSSDETLRDMMFIKDRLEDGSLHPVIDRTYPFERLPEAHAYVDAGHKAGNVVITMAHLHGA